MDRCDSRRAPAHTRRAMTTALASMTPVTADLWGDARRAEPARAARSTSATGARSRVLVGFVQARSCSPWTSAGRPVLLGAALAVRRLAPARDGGLAVVASVVQVVSGNVAWSRARRTCRCSSRWAATATSGVRRLGLACAVVAVVVAGGLGVGPARRRETLRGPPLRQRRLRRAHGRGGRRLVDRRVPAVAATTGRPGAGRRHPPGARARTAARPLRAGAGAQPHRGRHARPGRSLVGRGGGTGGRRPLPRADRPRPRAAGAGGHRRHRPLGHGRRPSPARPAA